MENEETKPELTVDAPQGAEIPEPAAESTAIEPTADAHCPNCNAAGIRKGKTIICQNCDASFRFTKEGPQVEELGPFDKLESRVAALEGSGITEPPEPEPPEPEPAKPQPAESEDDGI